VADEAETQGGVTPAMRRRGSASAKLALVATELGTGELKLRVRAVVCHEGPSGEWCGPESAEVSALVAVGPTRENGS